MKILSNTPEQLIVENNPVLIAIFVSVFALVFVAVGLFLIGENLLLGGVFVFAGLFVGVVFNIIFSRRTQVIFDRNTQTVEMRRKSLLGFTKRSWELPHFDGIIVQTNISDDSTTHRPVMVFSGGMDAGEHPLVVAYYSGKGAHTIAEAVNDWHGAAA